MVLMQIVCTFKRGEDVTTKNIKEKHTFQKRSTIGNSKIIDSF